MAMNDPTPVQGDELPAEARAWLATAATPQADDELRAQRIRKALSRRLLHKQPNGLASFGLRAAIGTGALLVAGIAAASFGFVRLKPSAPPSATQVSAPLQQRPRATSPPRTPQPISLSGIPATGPYADAKSRLTAVGARTRRGPVPAKPTIKTAVADPAPPPPQAVAPSTAESRLLLEVVRTLRRNNDAAPARALAARYEALYPSGALLEEAKALELEAAAKAGHKDVQALAHAYLKRFPQGRFVALARGLVQP